MYPWTYFAVFVAVVLADQLSKRWAVRELPALGAAGPGGGLAWTLSPCEPFRRLGAAGAASAWLLAGAAGSALCLTVPGGEVAALGGVAAWAAGASNLGEWWRRGAVVDWLRLWPRTQVNLADAALILGSSQLLVWIGVS